MPEPTPPAQTRDAKATLRRLVADEPVVRELYMRYLGVLGLLAEASVHMRPEDREAAERAFANAEQYGLVWRRVVDRLEITSSP